MERKKFWGSSRSAGVRMGLIVRIGLVLFAIVGSALLAWRLVGSQHGAHAAGVNEYNTTQNPWGVAFDKTGHIWVAEPACDASPVCGTPPQGIIGEYTLSTGIKVNDFKSSSTTIYTPVFLVVDGSGNVWFTDPTHNSIGELVPGSNTWTEWPASNGAAPYDLVMDSSGNIWFTEIQAGKIGFFNPSSHTFVETAIQTAGSNPYGITIAPNGTVWFAENGQPKIGSFHPSANGTITIAEHSISTASNPATPHLITSDAAGNIWYSEGFADQVGRYVPSTGIAKDFNASNNTCPTSTPSCPIHISGIAVDSHGMVWFTDSLAARVGFVNPANGVSVWDTLSSSSAHPHDGLAIDSGGNVWFTEQNGFKVGEVPAGSLVGGTPTATATATSPITTPPGPVNKTWYFAEGRVGGGFREYLTIDNPDSQNACPVNIQYFYTIDGTSSPVSKNVGVTVAPASRLTEWVNGDLGIQAFQRPAAILSAIVTVGSGSCNGVVAERPMYFKWNGIDSGTDVVGSTHTATTWNFGDVPTGGGYSSFITIMNPGAAIANVTATYYSGGQVVNHQTLAVAAGSRGTIDPNGLGLPQHVVAIVTSNQAVVVERPAYFHNVSGGAAGTVSGGTDVVGVPTLSSDWLFSEGYTGSGFQEKLVIANVDPAKTAANVTIMLEHLQGAPQTFNITVAANSQVFWDVNANAAGSPEVSADVSSTGAKILVERQMFFNYHHTVNGRTTTANGGTDVIGQVGPAAHASYSFAEGYNNVGYNQWLVLQNPTASAETIYVTLVNGYGRVYTSAGLSVAAHSRYTIDITATVVQHLVQSGDDHRGYEVSMTVQTLNGSFFVAERPMYWNTNGISTFQTQGGSDVIGYVGG